METEETMTKALENVGNRYLLANVIAERVKALKKRPSFSEIEVDGALIKKALKEVAEGKVKVKDAPQEVGAGFKPAPAKGKGGASPRVA